MRAFVLVVVAACSSSSSTPQTGIEGFAAQVKPVASSANKLVTDLEEFSSGFHNPASLFKADGPLAQVVTLVAAIGNMKRIELTGTAKVCADSFYGATDKMKGIIGGFAETLQRLKDKSEEPGVGTLMSLAAEWERKSDDYDVAVCALRTAAATCVESFTAAKIDPGALAALAAAAKDCKK